MWLTAAVCSSVFAGLTSILAKCGIRKTDSDVATALRTLVVLLFSWVMVFIVGSAEGLKTISARSALFLTLSGLATGASWICYFKALSMGDVNKVVPIDKSSTVMSVLLAMVLFHETQHLLVRLVCTALIGAGILLMVERKASTEGGKGPWMLYALLSAVFAALTSVLSKLGMTDVESNLATALRTGVVLVMALVIVLMKGKQGQLLHPDRKELGFIILSGLATGASWLCYYYAIQHGVVSVVVPIDKLSILVSIGFSYVVFKERLSRKGLLGLALMVAGTLGMTLISL
ncbi:MAG: EamA family transporter [Aristaeellaceae bacterium]